MFLNLSKSLQNPILWSFPLKNKIFAYVVRKAKKCDQNFHSGDRDSRRWDERLPNVEKPASIPLPLCYNQPMGTSWISSNGIQTRNASIQARVTSSVHADKTKQPASGVASVSVNVTADFPATRARETVSRIVTVEGFSESVSWENADAHSVQTFTNIDRHQY